MAQTKRKIFSVLCTTALMAGILAGCGGSEETSTPSKEGGSKTETVTLLINKLDNMEGLNAVAAEIEKKLNIKTEIEIRPAGGEGDNLVKTRLATGDMTDIMVYNSGSLLQALNPEKNFADLTSESYMANLNDSFKKAVTVNGKVYGVPFGSFSAGGWFYNKKVYKELGLSVPKTWAELIANNEKIKAAGKIPVIGSYKDTWTSQLVVLGDNYNVLAENPSYADDYTANKAKISNTPAALKSFEKMEELFKKGYMNKDMNSTNYDTALKLLAEGAGAHYPMLTFALPGIEAKYPDKIDDIGFFPQPGDSAEKNGVTVWTPGAAYVNKNSDHVEAAKKWVAFLASPEGAQLYMSKVKPDGPSPVQGVQLPDDVYAAVKEMLPYFENNQTAPALEFLSPVKGPNLEQITTQVGSGMITAKEGAKLYDKDVEKQAKQLGLKGW